MISPIKIIIYLYVWQLILCKFSLGSNIVQTHAVNSIGNDGGGNHCAFIHNEEATNYIQPPICIPIDFINQAFREARHAYGLVYPIPSEHLEANLNEIDRLGLVLVETSRIIAQHYNLNHAEIYNLLPRLDVSGTEIPKFCPVPFQSPYEAKCKLSAYRTLSGHCNNIYHPQWGAAFTPFQNLIPPQFSDGLSEPRAGNIVLSGHHPHHQISSTSSLLPQPRLVSQHIHQDSTTIHDHSITTMLIAWGQIIDHDITFTANTQDPTTFRTPECCNQNSPFETQHHNCLPIHIPTNDPFYSRYGQSCMNFARSLAGLRSDCRLGTRKAFNRISSFLDGNFIYGSNKALSKELRDGRAGLLKSLPIFNDIGLKDLLPLNVHEPNNECMRASSKNVHEQIPEQYCFLAGDIRANEQLILTVLHTIFLREHNRIAKILGSINSHWNDEKIFQETRRIIIAVIQHITFNEFLPMVLGKNTMEKYSLILETKGNFWDGYNPHLNPTASEEFVTSAFRFGHSLLPHKIERWSQGHRFIDSQYLHKLLQQPFDLYKPGFVDTYVLGLVNQLSQSMDEAVTDQVTTLLFKQPTKSYGMDLAAINIQRGREHGIPSFSSYRNYCTLSPISNNWNDLVGIIKNETIYRYKEIYSSPADIDLWSGGISEIPEKDSLIGPTFSCLIAKQFNLLRSGDRFWYELPNLPSSFTIDQLDEIRSVTLSRILCDNTDNVKTVQLYSMVYPDLITNPRVSCRGQVIPKMNLEKWREQIYQQQQQQPIKPHHYVPIQHDELDNHLQILSPPSTLPHDVNQIRTPQTMPFNYDNNNLYHNNYYNYKNNHYYQPHHQQLDFNNPADDEEPSSLSEGPGFNYNHNYNDINNNNNYTFNHHPFSNNYINNNNNNNSLIKDEGEGVYVYGDYEANNYNQANHRSYPQLYPTASIPTNTIIGNNYDYTNTNDNNNIYDNDLIKSPPPIPAVHYSPISLVLKPPQQSSIAHAASNYTHNYHVQQQQQQPQLQESKYQSSILSEPGGSEHNHQIIGFTNGIVIDGVETNLYGNPKYLHKNRHYSQDDLPSWIKVREQEGDHNPHSKIIEIEKPVHHAPPPTATRRFYRPPLIKRLPNPYPNSPFPGWSGLFSPNPGYLVRQKFYVQRG